MTPTPEILMRVPDRSLAAAVLFLVAAPVLAAPAPTLCAADYLCQLQS